jgi:hypothetical protein
MTMKRTLSGMLLLLLACGSADAALLSRVGGQAYYDDVLDITWLADANYAYTSGFDGNGLQQWGEANNYVAWLNTNNHLGSNTWRLPTIVDSGALGCQFTYNGTDCGYNVDLNTSEMAHLFYSTLGNVGYYDTSGVATGCSVTTPLCLTNTGPFSNVDDYYYWSGTTYAQSPTQAWYFGFGTGSQNYNPKTNGYRAWAVMSGDISPVPVPSAVWLFGSALGVMGLARRKLAS